MPATKGRFSILTLMAVVSIVAVECGLLRFLVKTTWLEAVMIFPLLNVMAFGLTRLRRGEEARRYWVGFEATGMTLIGLCFLLAWYAPAALQLLIEPLQWLGERGWIGGNGPEWLLVDGALVVAIYAPPQLLLASLAGWLASRYRIAIERRPRSAPATLAGS